MVERSWAVAADQDTVWPFVCHPFADHLAAPAWPLHSPVRSHWLVALVVALVIGKCEICPVSLCGMVGLVFMYVWLVLN